MNRPCRPSHEAPGPRGAARGGLTKPRSSSPGTPSSRQDLCHPSRSPNPPPSLPSCTSFPLRPGPFPFSSPQPGAASSRRPRVTPRPPDAGAPGTSRRTILCARGLRPPHAPHGSCASSWLWPQCRGPRPGLQTPTQTPYSPSSSGRPRQAAHKGGASTAGPWPHPLSSAMPHTCPARGLPWALNQRLGEKEGRGRNETGQVRGRGRGRAWQGSVAAGLQLPPRCPPEPFTAKGAPL